MKHLITAAVLFLTAVQVHARSIKLPLVYKSQIATMNIGHDYMKGINSVIGGDVTLDLDRNEAVLTLATEFSCGPNEVCAMVMPAPIEINLPIVEIFTDYCGSVIYKAHKDLRPADGVEETLLVSDNTTNTCLTLVALPATDISYETRFENRLNGSEVVQYSSFTGSKLVR